MEGLAAAARGVKSGDRRAGRQWLSGG